jgi:hypothetical protein
MYFIKNVLFVEAAFEAHDTAATELAHQHWLLLWNAENAGEPA